MEYYLIGARWALGMILLILEHSYYFVIIVASCVAIRTAQTWKKSHGLKLKTDAVMLLHEHAERLLMDLRKARVQPDIQSGFGHQTKTVDIPKDAPMRGDQLAPVMEKIMDESKEPIDYFAFDALLARYKGLLSSREYRSFAKLVSVCVEFNKSQTQLQNLFLVMKLVESKDSNEYEDYNKLYQTVIGILTTTSPIIPVKFGYTSCGYPPGMVGSDKPPNQGDIRLGRIEQEINDNVERLYSSLN